MTLPENIPCVGARFSHLVVIGRAPDYVAPNSRGHKAVLICRCDCGKEKAINVGSLKRGLTTSCGCEQKKRASAANKARALHGQAGRNETREYRTWSSMIKRCTNPDAHNYKYYGARGISVCARWHDFRLFFADMGARPEGRTLDRIDVDGNYEPGNCRWATNKEQANNKRNSRRIP